MCERVCSLFLLCSLTCSGSEMGLGLESFWQIAKLFMKGVGYQLF